MRFFGLTPARSRPRPSAFPGVRASIPPIHLGISGSVPGAGRLRQLRTAISSNSTPKTIFPHAMDSEADVLVEALPCSARS